MQTNNISEVGEHCFGCTACTVSCPVEAIKMNEDVKGFLFPSVDESLCTKCRNCINVCPYLVDAKDAELFPNLKVYAVKHKDDQVRMQSSSGGVFTALSDYVLKQNGVIYGATFNDSMEVKHQRANDIEERDKFRGSKYVQSDVGKVFIQVKEDLQDSKWVLFTGTPCQIAGLKLYLGKEYDKLVTVDLICHGVPSPKLFSDYLCWLKKKKNFNDIKYANFRDKVDGWKDLTLSITKKNGETIYIKPSKSAYYKFFLQNISLRNCCYECRFTNFNRQGDITIADFWGIENTQPDFYDEMGVSLTIINSKTGLQLFEKISDTIIHRESDQISCKQHMLYAPAQPSLKRDSFWKDYLNKGFPAVERKYGKTGLQASIKAVIRIILIQTGLIKYYRMLR